MKFVFIAIPTVGTVKDGAMTEEFLKFLAKLHVEHPEITFVSPMVQDYQILKYMDVEPVWEEWGKHCRLLIERADEVWVLKFNGWDTSVGVAGEIEHARSVGKPIEFIDPFQR